MYAASCSAYNASAVHNRRLGKHRYVPYAGGGWGSGDSKPLSTAFTRARTPPAMMEASRKGLIKNELESFVSCETTLYLLTAETWASREAKLSKKNTQ